MKEDPIPMYRPRDRDYPVGSGVCQSKGMEVQIQHVSAKYSIHPIYFVLLLARTFI
jgi:hypothetical protein